VPRERSASGCGRTARSTAIVRMPPAPKSASRPAAPGSRRPNRQPQFHAVAATTPGPDEGQQQAAQKATVATKGKPGTKTIQSAGVAAPSTAKEPPPSAGPFETEGVRTYVAAPAQTPASIRSSGQHGGRARPRGIPRSAFADGRHQETPPAARPDKNAPRCTATIDVPD